MMVAHESMLGDLLSDLHVACRQLIPSQEFDNDGIERKRNSVLVLEDL